MERMNVPSGSERMARATMAAILAASSENCQCEACRILREVSKEIKGEFLQH